MVVYKDGMIVVQRMEMTMMMEEARALQKVAVGNTPVRARMKGRKVRIHMCTPFSATSCNYIYAFAILSVYVYTNIYTSLYTS